MRYFPDPISGWIFLSGLLALLAVASYTDQRTMKVPKWLSIPAFVLGLLASIIRGGWLASAGHSVWMLGESSVPLGMLDGLLFALAGAVVGFALFFGMWMLGVCGGGDVKLFAALGAWIGPSLVVAVLAVSLLLLWVYVLGVFLLRLMSGRRLVRAGSRVMGSSREPLIIRYSLIASLAAVMVLLWAFRHDLQLIPSRPNLTTAGVHRAS